MRLQAELAQLLGAMDVLLAGVSEAAAGVPPPKKVSRLVGGATAAASASVDGDATAATAPAAGVAARS